jgi:hypothetical protein
MRWPKKVRRLTPQVIEKNKEADLARDRADVVVPVETAAVHAVAAVVVVVAEADVLRAAEIAAGKRASAFD